MLRTNQSTGDEKSAQDGATPLMDAQERQRKRAARRTAWILGAIAIALFIASLVHGHYSFIPHWPS